MNVSANAASLAALTRDLKRQWEQTRVAWRDLQAVDFEERHLKPLFECTETAVVMMEKLDQALAKMRSDCE